MSVWSRIIAWAGGKRNDSGAERVAAMYRELRPELLEDSELVFRVSDSGEPFVQVCPQCRSIDMQTAEWLGPAFRCRDCGSLLLPAGSGTRVLEEGDKGSFSL